MSTRKQREIMRLRRIEFDKRVEENRKNMEKFVKENAESSKGHKLLEDMTKQELVAYAYEKEIKIDKYAKKEVILEAIKKVE